MSELCKWLHEQLEQLPLIKFPFKLEQLPLNGIYFFYENGETWGHGGDKPRIVRIGNHRGNNFRNRIKEHFLLDERKMDFNSSKPAPKDRSIFRKNIGRALLNKDKSPYLEIWNVDLIPKKNREKYRHLRKIELEKEIEEQVTYILRNNFSFRFMVVENEDNRKGKKGLESTFIGTISHCKLCRPSSNWLGLFSPKIKIAESGLWLEQHLGAKGMNEDDKRMILNAIKETKEWIKKNS